MSYCKTLLVPETIRPWRYEQMQDPALDNGCHYYHQRRILW